MKLRLIGFWLGSLLLLVGACQNVRTEEASSITSPSQITPLSLTPTMTVSLQLDNNSPTPSPSPSTASTPSSTPSSSSTPPLTPSPTRLPVDDLIERGSLWVWQNAPHHYQVIDLEQGHLDIVAVRQDCMAPLRPRTTQVICQEKSKGTLYLLDLVTNQVQNVSIQPGEWYRWSPNGQFLFYKRSQGEKDETFFSYEFSTGITQTLATKIDPTGRHIEPILSANGQYLVQISNRGVELIKDSSIYEPIGLEEPTPTTQIAWSPVASQLIYRATDVEPYEGYTLLETNHLFLVNMTTKQNTLLSNIEGTYEFGRLFGQPNFTSPWSPDGKQIIVVATIPGQSQNLCVITVETGDQACQRTHPLFSGWLIRAITWSPEGNQIAFWRGPALTDRERDLVVAIPGESKQIVLLENTIQRFDDDFLMFWR